MEQFGNQESWYPFVARAELLVGNSDASLVADVRELSRQGCRLRLSGRPTPGASVVVKIYACATFVPGPRDSPLLGPYPRRLYRFHRN